MAPVISAFFNSKNFTVVTVFTGQHPDLINPFLDIFNISVDVCYGNIVKHNQSVPSLIAKIMIETEKLSHRESDIWIVQGDTSTAYAIATVAFHRGIRIAHVEAGLRTYNMYSPFPEEFNRKTISSIATFHFAPTEENKHNLLREGIPEDHIFVTGNTVLDAVKYLHFHNLTRKPLFLKETNLKNKTLVLITLHRRENIRVMSKIFSTVKSVRCPECLFVIPVHPNPNVAKYAREVCQKDLTRFICAKPLAYTEIHWILQESQFVLTDSGGIQEESSWYSVPVIILRRYSDRIEAVKAGVAVLVGHDWSLLEKTITSLLANSNNLFTKIPQSHNLFGYGNASQQILQVLQSIDINLDTKYKLPPADLSVHTNNLVTNFFSVELGLVLQVYKRDTLQKQLETVMKQTLLPTTIVVLQNGHYVDVGKEIRTFRLLHPGVELQHIAASKNLRFHGRFHIAYMMKEPYVSVWDDDILPRPEWLEYCIQFSKSHGNALVGAHGKVFVHIHDGEVIQRESFGRSDFVGHTWTLPRIFLRYFLESEMFTLHTGEDIQLSFALQKIGIQSWKPVESGNRSVAVFKGYGNELNIASWKQNQAPRQLLFCQILRAGFKPLHCSNCADNRVTDSCIHNITKEAERVEKLAQEKDKDDNDLVAWTTL